MTGAAQALLGLGYNERTVVTVEDAGGGAVGFSSSPAYGSLSTSTFRGKSITLLQAAASYDFGVKIDDASPLPQSFFTRVVIEDGTGAARHYASSSATFISGGAGGEFWTWGTGSSPVFVAGDNAEQHPATFYL